MSTIDPNQEMQAIGDPVVPETRAAEDSRLRVAAMLQSIRSEVGKAFIGQESVLDDVLAGLLAGGHLLLEGKPGLGKTRLVVALAQAIDGDFGRIQFTPELMPSDVTGFSLFDMKSQIFRVSRGPVFTNLLLADEINRAPAKTQAALLEVMQERQVTIEGESYQLERPFMTFATQNPIEHEGTYPLPEAQLDRFLMKLVIDYPVHDVEVRIVREMAGVAGASGAGVRRVCSVAEIVAAQDVAAATEVVDEVVDYCVAIARATRESPAFSLGAGTRGAIDLLRVGKARALMAGRHYVIPDDIKASAAAVLRHRVQLTPEMTISGQSVDRVLEDVVAGVPAPRV